MTIQHSLLATMMSSTFEEPFEMLMACHQRLLHMLARLERLGEHLDRIGADKSARQTAHDLVRFFDLAAAHLHNDEELQVIPQLRGQGNDVLAQRILDEHRALARDWALIREGLKKVTMQSGELREGQSVRRSAWHRFAADYRAHLALEEREVFPRIEAA